MQAHLISSPRAFGSGELKIFLSETTRPRALIFGMYYHLVDLYQLCSNYALGAKPGSHMFHIGLYREKHEIIFLSETIRIEL